MILMKTVIIHDSSEIFIRCETLQKPGLESVLMCMIFGPRWSQTEYLLL